jgi:hypothetical protein
LHLNFAQSKTEIKREEKMTENEKIKLLKDIAALIEAKTTDGGEAMQVLFSGIANVLNALAVKGMDRTRLVLHATRFFSITVGVLDHDMKARDSFQDILDEHSNAMKH